MAMSGKDSRGSRDRHFERRLKAAKAGLHLPTEIELLRGMSFLFDDMASDIREFHPQAPATGGNAGRGARAAQAEAMKVIRDVGAIDEAQQETQASCPTAATGSGR